MNETPKNKNKNKKQPSRQTVPNARSKGAIWPSSLTLTAIGWRRLVGDIWSQALLWKGEKAGVSPVGVGAKRPGARADAGLTVAVLCVCRAQSPCLVWPRYTGVGGGWSHFIISPQAKEASAPQSPAGCS